MDLGLAAVPRGVMIKEVLLKLDMQTLCSVACVSKALRFSVSEVLRLLSSLHLSALSPDARTLAHIFCRCSGLKSVTLNCLRLEDSSVGIFLGAHLEELSMLSCSLLSYKLLAFIGQSCPTIRQCASIGSQMSRPLRGPGTIVASKCSVTTYLCH
ncbi:F-box protein At-B [Morella rubra]|uniref:F-box protein At-B n=1 Tax=Morella rubra TaxID=262757 RepID=A0A6A1VQ00_9ROSI|nr:F-box protein At-B [Morella rubra]